MDFRFFKNFFPCYTLNLSSMFIITLRTYTHIIICILNQKFSFFYYISLKSFCYCTSMIIKYLIFKLINFRPSFIFFCWAVPTWNKQHSDFFSSMLILFSYITLQTKKKQLHNFWCKDFCTDRRNFFNQIR